MNNNKKEIEDYRVRWDKINKKFEKVSPTGKSVERPFSKKNIEHKW